MARKLKNIIIKKFEGQYVFRIWMDYEIADLVIQIPGVVGIEKPDLLVDNQYDVAFDPRYDWEELQSEIETLANSYAEG